MPALRLNVLVLVPVMLPVELKVRVPPLRMSELELANAYEPESEPPTDRVNEPPLTLTAPVLLRPLDGLMVTALVVFLFSVPEFTNRPRPLFVLMGVVAEPSRFQVPALVNVSPLLINTWAAPLWLTVRLAKLVRFLKDVTVPLMLVAESRNKVPMPLRLPPLKVLPPASVMSPVPPNVPPLMVNALTMV